MTNSLFLKVIAFSTIILCQCSSNLINYKDKQYWAKQSGTQNRIYVCPIDAVRFDDTAKAYTQYFLKQSPSAIEDTAKKYFNIELSRISKNFLKKKKAMICDTENNLKISINDTSQLMHYKIFNKTGLISIDISFPNKQYMNSIGFNCDYAIFFNDITIFQSHYYIPIFIPLPGAFVAGHTSGPAFGIKGKYVLWDYEKEKAICAGEFKSNFMTCNIGNKDVICDKAYNIISSTLNKTPYWKSDPFGYEEEQNGSTRF